MLGRIARANARRSTVRSAVEHVFAGQKHRMALFIHTIGTARAQANLAYNFDQLIFHERCAAMGYMRLKSPGRPESPIKTSAKWTICPQKPSSCGHLRGVATRYDKWPENYLAAL
jgi:hypothetical protein